MISSSIIERESWRYVSKNMFIKINNDFGVPSKATGWAPEVGVMFSFGGR